MSPNDIAKVQAVLNAAIEEVGRAYTEHSHTRELLRTAEQNERAARQRLTEAQKAYDAAKVSMDKALGDNP